jgi:formate--tetrahydrofolate ligase
VETSLRIAQAATLRPIAEIAAGLGLEPGEIESYGRDKAKVALSVLDRLADAPDGKLIAVTAVTPTPKGEGKTTTSVALTQGLARIGRRPVLCLREASLGPVFGVKGGAAGGGHSQVVPMEDLNLHFTGDLHAITAANNLLAAMIDAHLLHRNEAGIDPLAITWRRCLDMNDRALRDMVTGLGGKTNGYPRQSGFDITAASETMAIVAMSRDLADLRRRLGAITIAETREGSPVTADAIRAAGAMAVILKDALKPNLVQTLEGQPAFVHCGPFANIAHGCSSLVATRMALKLGELVITEGGFASDMGMEKLFDIVCRLGGLKPSAVVLVATVQALRHHGRGDLELGAENLGRHLGIAREFGVNPVVAVNRFPGDTDEELETVKRLALGLGAHGAEISEGFERGGEGAEALARAVALAAEDETHFAPVYELDSTIETKIETIARRIYGADGADFTPQARQRIERLTAAGLGGLPICMAKTHLSLSDDQAKLNAPEGFRITVRDLRPYTGAGWLLALCGEMQTMPGLGPHPAAFEIDIDANGRTVGLF